jgi:mannosyltransferase OCH1-like enzyme
VTPRRIVTTWVTDGRDRYTDAHREMFARCLASWLKHCPGWDIQVVTAANVFAHGTDATAERWLRDGHFIGVSQWARLHWLQELGGVYLDMDVEVVASLEPLLAHGFAVGHEGGDDFANNAVIAADAGHPFLQAQLDEVLACDPRNPQFGNETGPRMLTRLLRRAGWSGHDRFEDVSVCGRRAVARVLPSDVLYPTFYRPNPRSRGVTPRTLAVHHWGASWVDKGEK